MKFSVWPNSANPVAEALDTAQWAEANGFHGVWYADHYMPNTGSEDLAPGPMHECWSVLPAMAVVTDRVRIGSLVAPTSVHHPALLANRAATIDELSNGRMVLGMGAGWQINEHHAYGIELQAPKQRVDRFEEAIAIVRSLLDQPHTDFDGEYYTITNAPSDPKPIQSPMPILVGTGGTRMMRITARYANEWNTWGGVEMATSQRAKFVAACEAVGVDPATRLTSVQALVALTDTEADAEAVLGGPMGSRMIAGTADSLIEQLTAYADAGFEEFIIPDFNLGGSAEARRESYERLKADVVDRM